MRDVNAGPGSLGQFHVARDKVRVRMSFQDGHDLKLFPLRRVQVIAHVPLGIDDRRFT